MPASPTDPVEIELKFALGPGAREALEAELFHGAETSQLTAAYFDTPDLALFNQGYVLRVRRKGERFIQTLKHSGDGVLARGEWEAQVPSASVDAGALVATPAASLVTPGDLTELFTVRVQRTATLVTHGSTRIEAVLDLGEVRAGDHREAVAELELELVEGAPADLFAFARTLDAPLVLAFETKSERGYRLAKGATAAFDGAQAALRGLSEAILAEDQAAANAAARNLGVEPPAAFDRAAWARVLLDAAERAAGLPGADT